MHRTTSDLITLLEEETGDVSPSSSTYQRFIKLLNRANHIIHAGGGELNLDRRNNPVRRPFIFPWALSDNPKLLTLLPLLEGEALVTENSPAVTIDINSATTDLTGYEIKFNDIIYKISTHTGTTIALDSNYIGTTETLNFKAFQLTYTVGSDILIPTDEIKIYNPQGAVSSISIVEINKFYDLNPKDSIGKGTPTMAGLVRQGDGSLTIRFNRYPEQKLRAELAYVVVPADLVPGSVDPTMPEHHRTVLVHLAAFYHLVKRDDDRASSHLETAKNLFDNLTTETRQFAFGNDENYGHVSPWPGGFYSGFRSYKGGD